MIQNLRIFIFNLILILIRRYLQMLLYTQHESI